MTFLHCVCTCVHSAQCTCAHVGWVALNRIARVWQRPAPACQGEDTTFSSDGDDNNANVDNDDQLGDQPVQHLHAFGASTVSKFHQFSIIWSAEPAAPPATKLLSGNPPNLSRNTLICDTPDGFLRNDASVLVQAANIQKQLWQSVYVLVWPEGDI